MRSVFSLLRMIRVRRIRCNLVDDRLFVGKQFVRITELAVFVFD